MSVIGLLLVLALLGLVTWAITRFIPMPVGIRNLIMIVAVVIGVLYVLQAFGIGLPSMRLPR